MVIQDTAHYLRLRGDQPLLSLTESPRQLSPLGNTAGPSASGDIEYPAGAFAFISQDINTFTINNPCGYLGKCSCLWWIQRARQQLGKSIPLVIAIDTMVDPRVPSVERLGAFPTGIFVYPPPQLQ